MFLGEHYNAAALAVRQGLLELCHNEQTLPMIINRKFGDYLLIRRLAVGGQSEVYLALKIGPGDYIRTVVIKLLPQKMHHDPKFLQLFFKEAFISSRLTHPHIITTYDARQIEDQYCLVMDFVAGQTVADIAQRGFQQDQPILLEHAVRIIADACDGLYYAHKFRDLDDSSYSIVHCDISPQNLMVTYQGVTKVFDFGIAHIPGYEDTNTPMTVGGKFAYMSPEQLTGQEVTSRSDIFSLGIILYELCAGYRLFRRKSQPEVMRAILEDPIQPPSELRPDLPISLERCIMRALERDPTRRYQNAAQMRDDLLQFLAVMSKGSVRDSLGDYVAGLFVQERQDIAQLLHQANQGELLQAETTTQDFDRQRSGFEPFAEQTMDLDPKEYGIHPEPSRDPEQALVADQEPGGSIASLEKKVKLLSAVVVALVAVLTLLGVAWFQA